MEFIEVEENHSVSVGDIERTVLMFVTEDDRCLLLSIYEEHDVTHTAGLGVMDVYLAHNSQLESVYKDRVYMNRAFRNRIVRFFETHEGNNVWLHIAFMVGDEVKIIKVYGCPYSDFKTFVRNGKTIMSTLSSMYI